MSELDGLYADAKAQKRARDQATADRRQLQEQHGQRVDAGIKDLERELGNDLKRFVRPMAATKSKPHIDFSKSVWFQPGGVLLLAPLDRTPRGR